jgi:hypothetical protein
MFQAILLPKSQDLTGFIEDKTIVYLPPSKYIICITSEDNIPKSIKDDLIPVVINTKYSQPVKAYQHYVSNIEDLSNPRLNRELMAMKSKLVYAISENLSPDKLYFRLEIPMNENSTKRNYIYKLYYQDIPCYTLKDDDLLENFINATDQKLGPLITSTHALSVEGVPHWYVKEIFRDDIFSSKNMTIINGPNSGELYLFYKDEVNITEDILTDLINEIRGDIISSVRLKIFPRNTPSEFIKSRRLEQMNNGQWKISYDVPSNINVFSEILKTSFTFKSLDELFWFLLWLVVQPTYPFIEQEMRINTGTDSIKVCYATKYLPDFMRVNSASRVNLPEDSKSVQIIYPDRSSEKPMEQTYLSFYDHGNNEKALLIYPNPIIPNNNYIPSDYSLDSRIQYDLKRF